MKSMVKLTSLLASQNRVEDNTEFTGRLAWFPMYINSLNLSKHSLEGSRLSSSHRAHTAEKQTKALILRLAELQ